MGLTIISYLHPKLKLLISENSASSNTLYPSTTHPSTSYLPVPPYRDDLPSENDPPSSKKGLRDKNLNGQRPLGLHWKWIWIGGRGGFAREGGGSRHTYIFTYLHTYLLLPTYMITSKYQREARQPPPPPPQQQPLSPPFPSPSLHVLPNSAP